MHITNYKKPIWKAYILYDSNFMTFQKRQNYGDSKMISVVARVGMRQINRQGTEDFQGNENTLLML